MKRVFVLVLGLVLMATPCFAGYDGGGGWDDSGGSGADSDWTIDGTNTYTTLGNVGIGTSSPAAQLDIAGITGDDAVALRLGLEREWAFEQESTGSASALRLRSSASKNFFIDGNDFALRDNGGANTKFIVKGSGNVGIGITSPTAILTAQGAGTTTGKTFELENASATKLMTVLDSGNVGIGTTSPTATLDVAGDMKVSTSLTASEVYTDTIVGTSGDGVLNINGDGASIISGLETDGTTSFDLTVSGGALYINGNLV